MAFSPKAIVINAGTRVTWTNKDPVAHTVTKDSGDTYAGDVPVSGNIGPGETYSNTFSKAGTFHYHCAIHPEMTGTVTVMAAPESGQNSNDQTPSAPDSTAPTPAASDNSTTGDTLNDVPAPAAEDNTNQMVMNDEPGSAAPPVTTSPSPSASATSSATSSAQPQATMNTIAGIHISQSQSQSQSQAQSQSF
jgi:hypothetical protein